MPEVLHKKLHTVKMVVRIKNTDEPCMARRWWWVDMSKSGGVGVRPQALDQDRRSGPIWRTGPGGLDQVRTESETLHLEMWTDAIK